MISFNKTYLDQLAKEKGFIRDNLEKVMRLAEILRFFNHDALLLNALVLKGGTAINLTVFQMPRLSVDIDLDFAHNCDREKMLTTRQLINERILAYMNKEGYLLKTGSKNPHALDSWIFGYTNAGGNPDNIKIEINYSCRCHVQPLEQRAFSIDYLGVIQVNTLSPTELFASKLNALINRAAVRDVYDIHGMLAAHLFEKDSELDLLRKTLVFYMAVGSTCKAEEVSLNFKNFKYIEGLTFSQVKTQLLPVLNHSEKFDFNTCKEQIISFLQAFLTFTDEERLFIEHFNRRDYRPDLLFGEGEITERVGSHPMALWKCRARNDVNA